MMDLIDRRSGITKNMVESLPSEALVVVHSTAMLHYVRAMIRDLRGREFAAGCKVIIINSHSGLGQLEGIRRAVVVDHAVSGVLSPSLANTLYAIVDRVNFLSGSPAP